MEHEQIVMARCKENLRQLFYAYCVKEDIMKEISFIALEKAIENIVETTDDADKNMKIEELSILRIQTGFVTNGEPQTVENIQKLTNLPEEKILQLSSQALHTLKEMAVPSASLLVEPLVNLHLSTRTYNALTRNGFHTVADVCARNNSFEDFSRIRNLGRTSFDELVAKLHEHGFYFKNEKKVTNLEIQQKRHQILKQEYIRLLDEIMLVQQELSKSLQETFEVLENQSITERMYIKR